MMKEDTWLIAAVFLIWMLLAILYFSVPMIYMPVTGRVWGLGALLFLALGVAVAMAEVRGPGQRRDAGAPPAD